MQPILNRRQIIKHLATLSLGTAILPLPGDAKPLQTDPLPQARYIPPMEGKKGKVGNMEIIFKLNSKDTANRLGIWESIIQPGELGAPPHYHKGTDEICRVLEGSVTILTGEEVIEVKAGGWHLRPRGVVHTFWNGGFTPAKTIDLCTPGGHEFYMQELATLFENNARPGMENLKKLEQKYDIHYRFDLLQGIMEKYKVRL